MITDNNFYTVLLVKEMLGESFENLIVKNLKAKDNFDEFVVKPENKGDPFTKEELDSLENLDTKPYKVSTDEIRFSATEPTNNKNKEMAVVKKQNRYVVFFSVRNPVDISPVKDISDKEVDERDDIIIKISKPFDKKDGDPSLLYNVVDSLSKEYQI